MLSDRVSIAEYDYLIDQVIRRGYRLRRRRRLMQGASGVAGAALLAGLITVALPSSIRTAQRVQTLSPGVSLPFLPSLVPASGSSGALNQPGSAGPGSAHTPLSGKTAPTPNGSGPEGTDQSAVSSGGAAPTVPPAPSAAPTSPTCNTADLGVRVTTDRTSYRSGTPVSITVLVRNRSPQPCHIPGPPPGCPKGGVTVWSDAQGDAVPGWEEPQGPASCTAGTYSYGLAPGVDYTWETVVWNQQFCSSPGNGNGAPGFVRQPSQAPCQYSGDQVPVSGQASPGEYYASADVPAPSEHPGGPSATGRSAIFMITSS